MESYFLLKLEIIQLSQFNVLMKNMALASQSWSRF